MRDCRFFLQIIPSPEENFSLRSCLPNFSFGHRNGRILMAFNFQHNGGRLISVLLSLISWIDVKLHDNREEDVLCRRISDLPERIVSAEEQLSVRLEKRGVVVSTIHRGEVVVEDRIDNRWHLFRLCVVMPKLTLRIQPPRID